MFFIGIVIILIIIITAIFIQYFISQKKSNLPKKINYAYEALIISKPLSKEKLDNFIQKVKQKSRRLIFSTRSIPLDQIKKQFDTDKIFIPKNNLTDGCGYELMNIPNSNIIIIIINPTVFKFSYCSKQLNKDLIIAQKHSKIVYIIFNKHEKNILSEELIWKKINPQFASIINGIFLTDNSQFLNISKWKNGYAWNIGPNIYTEFPLNSPLELSSDNIQSI